MELIYAKEISTKPNLVLEEVLVIDNFINFEMILSSSNGYDSNDFELQITKEFWQQNGLEIEGWVYSPNTEWIGRIENIHHVNGIIKLSGPNIRAVISRWSILPPSHFDKTKNPYVYVTMPIDKAPQYLLVDYESKDKILNLKDAESMFNFIDSEITSNVDYNFRYTNSLKALNQLGDMTNCRLVISHTYDGENPFDIGYVEIQNLSDTIEISNDYSSNVSSKITSSQSYNCIVGLGQGNLADRQTITKYRLDDGTIVETIPEVQKETFVMKTYIYDYSSVESYAELEKGVLEKMEELKKEETVSITIDPVDEIYLGDIVAGFDEVTGLRIETRITEKRLTINSEGVKIEYKAGD